MIYKHHMYVQSEYITTIAVTVQTEEMAHIIIFLNTLIYCVVS